MLSTSFRFRLSATLVLSLVLPAVASVLVELYLSDWRWIQERFHSVIEGTGALIAISAAVLLLLRKRVQPDLARFTWVASAFIGMGLLDEFHSWVHAGAAFAWTHAAATLLGGVIISLIWLPARFAQTRLATVFPALAVVASVTIGTLILVFRDQLPEFVSGGNFTPAVIAPNVLGGLLFMVAGVNFIFGCRRTGCQQGCKNDLLFTNLCFLFGEAGLLFPYSQMWDAGWWYWHLLRLLAYFIVFGFAFSVYYRLQEDLRDNEARNRALLHAIPDWIFRFRLDGTLLDFRTHDPSLRPQMMIGANIYDSPLQREIADQFMAASRQAAATGKLQTMEFASSRRSELRHYEAQIVASATNELIAIVRNITERKQAEEALRRMSKVYMDSTDPIVIVGPDGRIIDLNTETERVYGWTRAELLGQPFQSIIPPERGASMAKHLMECLQGEVLRDVKGERLTKAGRRFPVLCSFSLLLDDKEKPVAAAILSKDISELKRVEEELRESEAKFRALSESTTAAVFIHQGEWLHYANPAAEALTGYTREEILKMRFWDVMHPDFQELVKDRGLRRQQGEPVPSRYEVKIIAKNGEERWLDLTAGVTMFQGKSAGIATAFDITEQKRAENALRQSQEDLRALAGRLLSAKEEEDKRLARELHDVFSQRLAVLGMQISAVKPCSTPACDPLNEALQQVEEEIGSLAKDVHQLSRQLHPSILDDIGLAGALRAECSAFTQQHGVSAKFLPADIPDRLANEISLSLYRIAQESLWNIAKYAQAQEVQVSVSRVNGEMILAVKDNGKGFDRNQTDGNRGLGLVSMEERARLVGGTFSIHSEPGKGTRVEVRIPLPRGA